MLTAIIRLLWICNGTTMRTFPAAFVVHPSFDDGFQLGPQIGDVERFFAYNSRFNVDWVGTIPAQAV